MLDNYNRLLEELKTFDDFSIDYKKEILINVNDESPFIPISIKEFKIYCNSLDTLYQEAYFEIKKTIDDFLMGNNSVEFISIFLQGKIDDIQHIFEIIKKRDFKAKKATALYWNSSLKNRKGIAVLGKKARQYYNGEISYGRLYGTDGTETLPSRSLHEPLVTIICKEGYQRKLVDKMYKELQELQKIYQYPPIKENEKKIEKVFSKQEKDFSSYLHHDNKEALMLKLHELLDGKKGKVVAITIKALEQLGFISVTDTRSAIYKAMRKEFGEIGSDQSINPIMNNFTQYDSEIEQQKRILKEVK